MLPIVITSLALAKRRSMREIIPQKWRELWDDYVELRMLVLLSLTFQLILILLGGRRKRMPHYWLRIVVWLAYLSADVVAMYALGVIRVEPPPKCHDVSGGNSTTDSTTALRAFWAPFLLMHLGGPDTITAYALEDNELWLRHCLALVSQTMLTAYILLLSWNGSYISWLFVLILICGLIKYGERVWVLWAASSEQFRDSTPQRHQNILRMQEKKLLKQAEGYLVVAHQVIELHEVLDHGVGVDWHKVESELSLEELNKRKQGEMVIARGLIDIFRPAFTDQLLSLDDRETGRSTLQDKDYLSVFNIIAIELGFIYDLLFTKAMVFQTPWGIAGRAITLSLTTITLCVFTPCVFSPLYKKKSFHHTKTDLIITFVLMIMAILLELYVLLFHHLLSDKVMCWLIMKRHYSILSFINSFRPYRSRWRWSRKIGQFSLLSYCLKEKHYFFRRNVLEIQKYFYNSNLIISGDLKKHLYEHIRMLNIMYTDLQSLWALKWKGTLQSQELDSLKWSIELEFDMSILIWHIATDICFHADKTQDDSWKGAQVSLDLSRYMLHLLVMYPSLLPAGIGRIKFKDMYSMMAKFFEQHQSDGPKRETTAENATKLLLSQVNTKLNLTVSSRDKSKLVMFYGCQLASQLQNIKENDFRFLLLRETWIGMLVLAASKCKASYHVQQLRRGGELLTHVWLLMVHFGLTPHFQIPNAVEIAEMSIN